MKIYENHAQDARYDEKDTCPTITSRYGTGGGNVPLVIQEAYRISSDASNCMRSGNPYSGINKVDLAPTVDTTDPSPSKGQGGIAIVTKEIYCLAENTIGRQPHNGGNGNGWQKDLSYTLNATGVHGVKTEARVRKLTPVECERLQGFSDNYTRIPWKGKSAEECPDSPRYKAIGNSWAVPCVRWIGKRIQAELEKNK